MHNPEIAEALSYGDVLGLPNKSHAKSRYSDDIMPAGRFANRMPELPLAIVSANMDTVTEHRMAITMSLNGGLGVIHRFNTIDVEAEQVRNVKDYVRVREDHPPMLPETATIEDAWNLFDQRERGYVIVYPGELSEGVFSGLVTIRDLNAGEPHEPLSNVMKPKDQLISVPEGTTLEQAVSMMKKHRLEKIPVLRNDGSLVGMYTMWDKNLHDQYPNAAKDKEGRLLVGAAIGVKDEDIERAQALQDAGADVLVVDIAHGHSVNMELFKPRLDKANIHIPIVAGNFGSAEGVIFAHRLGFDGVKVGIGPGLICTTRDVAGIGVPQVTAIMEARRGLDSVGSDIPIIADGGIRQPGDLIKAFIAGADTVMIGSVFGGTDKSPGEDIYHSDGRHEKMVRGMASATAMTKREQISGTSKRKTSRPTPEGRTVFLPFKGSTQSVLRDYEGGLRSGMSYIGAETLPEARVVGQIVKITSAGANENKRQIS